MPPEDEPKGEATPAPKIDVKELVAALTPAITAIAQNAVADAKPKGPDPQAPSDGKPNGKESPKDKVAALEKELRDMQERAAAEKERTEQLQRDNALRESIRNAGFRDPDVVFALAKQNLQVQNGKHVFIGDDKIPVTSDRYLESLLEEKSWLAGDTGRAGGGSVGAGKPQSTEIKPPEGATGPELLEWSIKNNQVPKSRTSAAGNEEK